MFLPDEAVLVELFPFHVKEKKHFRNIARWRGHTYLPWKNRQRVRLKIIGNLETMHD